MNDHQALRGVDRSDGNDHACARTQLLEQRRRNVVGGGGDDDGVERGLFLPTEIAVTVADAAFGETGLFQAAERFLIKRPDDLDGVNVGRDFEENSGLVAAAGADLEDFLAGFDLEQFGHQRDDVRLADRLAVADRQRLIVVGLASQVRFHKLVPRHPAHGLEFVTPRARICSSTMRFRSPFACASSAAGAARTTSSVARVPARVPGRPRRGGSRRWMDDRSSFP